MHIGVAAPVDLTLIEGVDTCGPSMPTAYGFPFTAYLVNAYLKAGHDVSVFALSLDVSNDICLRFSALSLHVARYRRRSRNRMLDGFRVERDGIRRAIDLSGCDVVHAHWTYEFALGALSSGVPTLITVHDWAPAVLAQFRNSYRLYRLGMQFLVLNRSSHLTAPSPYLAGKASGMSIFRRPDVAVVPNALRPEAFESQAVKDLRPSNPQIVAPQLITIANGFTRKKNVSFALRAFAYVRERFPRSRLVLVGDEMGVGGPAHQWSMRRGLARGVCFLGQVPHPEISRLLDVADLLVHPAREESFGMTLIEAMARGVPVVGGAKAGAIPWVLGNGEAGILVELRNPSIMASEIVELIEDSARLREVGQKGYERARLLFSMETTVERYLDILQVIAGQGVVA